MRVLFGPRFSVEVNEINKLTFVINCDLPIDLKDFWNFSQNEAHVQNGRNVQKEEKESPEVLHLHAF